MIIGYKPTAVKSVDEYTQLDANDESLNRWKASLGIVPGASAPATGPKVRIHHDAQNNRNADSHALPAHYAHSGASLSHSTSWQVDRYQPVGWRAP